MWPDAKNIEPVDNMFGAVRLDPARYRDRFPQQLSGGGRHRVGIASALVMVVADEGL